MNLENLSVFSHKNNQGHVSRVVYIPGQDYIAATEVATTNDIDFGFADGDFSFSAPTGLDFGMEQSNQVEGFDFGFSEPVFA